MQSVIGYFREIFEGLWYIGVGMGVTAKHLLRSPTTRDYPNVRRVPGRRYRGIIRLVVDPATNEEKCVACMVCAVRCPNNCIRIIKEDDKKAAKVFDLDYSICLFCGICVQDCPYDALTITGDHEFAVTDKKDLVWTKDKMRLVTNDVRK